MAGFLAAFEWDASFFFTDEVVLVLDLMVKIFFCDLPPSFFPFFFFGGGGSETATAGLLGLFFPPWPTLVLDLILNWYSGDRYCLPPLPNVEARIAMNLACFTEREQTR